MSIGHHIAENTTAVELSPGSLLIHAIHPVKGVLGLRLRCGRHAIAEGHAA